MEMRSTKMVLEHSYLLPFPNPKQVLQWVYHGYTGIIMEGKLHCHLSGRVNGCSSTKNPWYAVGIAIIFIPSHDNHRFPYAGCVSNSWPPQEPLDLGVAKIVVSWNASLKSLSPSWDSRLHLRVWWIWLTSEISWWISSNWLTNSIGRFFPNA